MIIVNYLYNTVEYRYRILGKFGQEQDIRIRYSTCRLASRWWLVEYNAR